MTALEYAWGRILAELLLLGGGLLFFGLVLAVGYTVIIVSERTQMERTNDEKYAEKYAGRDWIL